jgi:hypothetical protein
MAIAVGTIAQSVAGVSPDGAHALIFYKVTCGTTQLATPAMERLAQAYPGKVTAVVQDPQAAIEDFARTYGLTFAGVPDPAPYVASDAFGIVSAPTLVVVDGDGRVAGVAESWDRDAWNRVSGSLAALLGQPAAIVSEPGDGLPDFKPG